MKRISGLPNVYQVYRGKPCVPRLSGGFLFAVLEAGLPDVYQADFLREKPASFSIFFCVLSTVLSMQGELCCHSWLKIPFSSSLRYFLPCFGRELSSAPEFKRRNSNEKPEACSQPGSHRGHDFRPDGDGLQRRELSCDCANAGCDQAVVHSLPQKGFVET